MQFLLITLEYPPFKGGIAHYYFSLVKNWPEEHTPPFGHPSQEGNNIKVIDNSENKLVDEQRGFVKWWPAIKTLKSTLKKDQDAYLLIGQILPLGTAAWLLSFFYNFKYCVFLHGYDLNAAMAQPRKRWLAQAILKKADKIICANSYTEGLVRKTLVSDKSRGSRLRGNDIICVNPGIEGETIAYNEAAIEALKKRYNLENKTVLLSVGRLTKRKGVDMALEALNLALNKAFTPLEPNTGTLSNGDKDRLFFDKSGVNNKGEVGPELVFVIIGQGDEEANLRAKIANLGLEKNTLILTDVDDEAKMNWYKLCDIFIMTARQIGADMEGFGIVYLEAGLAGKPVIAGQSGGVADAVEDNVNGLLVNPTNPEEISEAIIKLARYEKLRERLGDEGRKRALTMFNWKGQAEKIKDFLTKS